MDTIITHLKDLQLQPGAISQSCASSTAHWNTLPSAHLFKLYPLLCDLLGVVTGGAWLSIGGSSGEATVFDEGSLVDSVRACLDRIGQDLF